MWNPLCDHKHAIQYRGILFNLHIKKFSMMFMYDFRCVIISGETKFTQLQLTACQ